LAPKVEIVGAVETGRECPRALIEQLLDAPALVMHHDGEFTGRPTTVVHATDDCVLKQRAAPEGDVAAVRAFVEDALNRERLLRVHHPDKTWFLVERADGMLVGNVTPRLLPLHLREAEVDPARYFRHLRTMLQTYIRIAASFRLRLDEGLSNFGFDASGQLYYLDDDLYPWDDFAHFSQSIGVTIRKVQTLSPKFAQALGQFVRQAVVSGFGDSEPCRLIAESVRGLYFGGPLQQQRRDGFVEGLLGVSPHNRSASAQRQRPPMALIADVHANLPALTAVMDALRREGIEHGLVLGDIVGYGPHPRECLRLLRDSGFEIIRGNHDHAAATGERSHGFSETAFRVIEWTRQQLDAEELAWLGQLPTQIARDGWVAQHGAPMDPAHFNAYVYRLTYEDNLRYLAEHDIRWAFHGHTHTPSVYYATAETQGLDESSQQSLADYQQALICPGSVGQPRRGGLAAQWAVFNPATTQIEFHAEPYDVERTAQDMLAQQFPLALIERLRAGT